MSEIRLAELLDRLSATNEAFVIEAERSVTASNLSFESTVQLFALCFTLSWGMRAFDSGGSEWNAENISEDYAPYRVSIQKPASPPSQLRILTNVGFAKWLADGHAAIDWRVARLNTPITTRGRLYAPWDDASFFTPLPATKSPRSLVREQGNRRVAPSDIQPWILHHSGFRMSDPAFRVWANASLRALLNGLADEITSDSTQFKFKGPPKLLLNAPDLSVDHVAEFGEVAFMALQESAGWVYEIEREAELKHALLSGEIARAGGALEEAVLYFKRNIADACDAAKIAYQVAVSELGRDTLKLLGELRKAVTEETAKVTESIRQTMAAVASGLAVGFGLLAARSTTTASPWLLVTIMLVVVAYVAMVICSGWGYIFLQRRLRVEWQPRLYRFLPPEEYTRMVVRPTQQTETSFFVIAAIGGLAIIILSGAILYAALK